MPCHALKSWKILRRLELPHTPSVIAAISKSDLPEGYFILHTCSGDVRTDNSARRKLKIQQEAYGG